MSTRLTSWVNEFKTEGISEYEIACGLDNGEIYRPEWLCSSPCTALGYVIWDSAESCGQTNLYDLDTRSA